MSKRPLAPPASILIEENVMSNEAAVETKKIVRIKPDVTAYVNGRSSKGAKVKISGDLVSQLLDGLSLEDAYNLAEKALGEKHADLRTKYTKLNAGHQRMCIGNLLRGLKTDEDKERLSKLAAPFRKDADARLAAAAKVAEAKATERAEKKEAAAKKKAEAVKVEAPTGKVVATPKAIAEKAAKAK
jgi:hypothetical protein